MKILFVWTGVTSYMADCWRALQQLPGVELKIIVEQVASGSDFDASTVLHDLDYSLVQLSNLSNLSNLQTFKPDLLFAGGWRSANTRRIVDAFPDVPKVFCLDMPWRWSLRCVLARFALWRFLRKFDRIYVPGAWSARYARWLGFKPAQIERKLYAVNFGALLRQGCGGQEGERKGFLYVGRFAPEKRIDLLVKAYARYRELGGTWSFDLYGSGPIPQPSIYNSKTSAVDLGLASRPVFHPFAQPDELKSIRLSHACLVMASQFDPWPLVIAEATAAGMSVIASDRCGNGAELGARRVPFGDVEAMAREMLTVEREWSGGRIRPQVGLANPYAASYDCKAWARRTLEIAQRTCRIRGFCPGLDEPANGMAVVARLLARDEAFHGDYIVHGMWLPRGWWACLRHFGNYVRMTHGSLSPLYLEHQGKWKKRLVRPIERFLLRHARKVLATCEVEAEWIRAYARGIRDQGLGIRVEVTDIKRFFALDAQEKVEVEGKGRQWRGHILYLGRRHPLKGVEYLEKAVSELKKEHPLSTSTFDLDLRIVSNHSGDELESDWDWCDVLVLPTLSENFGLVVAEALERGKRVVTTDGAPAWEPEEGERGERGERGEKGEIRLGYGGKLVYLIGYRVGTDEERVELLKSGVRMVREGERSERR